MKASSQQLHGEECLSDVILACEDQQIQAHMFIISTCSLVFKQILMFDQNLYPIIYLRNAQSKDLFNLVNFMY